MIPDKKPQSKIRPEWFFLYTASFFGMLFIILTPPFSVPDEPNHFYRSWQVSEGTFTSVKKDNRVGGQIPTALSEFSNLFVYISLYDNCKYTQAQPDAAKEISSYKSSRQFTDFNNSALYSAVCYLPSGLAIGIMRSFNAPLLSIFYGARFFNLLFWITTLFFAIKIIPIYKWLFCLLALLPMSVFINSSLSADVVTNVICFFFIAYVLYFEFSTKEFTDKYFFLFLFFVFLLTSVKAIYSPLILMLLIISPSHFKSRKNQALKVGLLFVAGLFSALFWSSLINQFYISYNDYHPGFRDKAALVKGADIQLQLDYIFNNGLYIFKVFFTSLITAFQMYSSGYVGTLGLLDITLSCWVIGVCFAVIIITAATDAHEKIKFRLWHRFLFAALFGLILFLVFLSQHLIWDPVGGDKIGNIQGRYLIPFAPLLFFVFYGLKPLPEKVVSKIVIIVVPVLLCYSALLLYTRYFTSSF